MHDIVLCERTTGEVFDKELGYIYLELSKFTKSEKELISDLDRWLYVLKHISQMESLKEVFRKPIFEKLFNLATYEALTKEEKEMYNTALKNKWDSQAAMEHAINKGIKIGIEKGIEKGELKKGLTIAKALLLRNMPIDEVAAITNIQIEELKKL